MNLHKVNMYNYHLLVFSFLFVISIIKAVPCTTPYNETGECILLRECPPLREMFANKTTEATELIRQFLCGFADLDPLLCCASFTNSNVTPNQNKNKTNNESLLPDKRFCGYQHSDDYFHDTNSTSITESPWLASIVDGERSKFCLGSLINVNYVLTSAHCAAVVKQLLNLTVLLGEYHIQNNTDCVYEGGFKECSDPVEEFTINKTIVHSEYKVDHSLKKLENNIGLIRLNGKVSYSDYIRPICLPLSGTKLADVGDTLTMFTWGSRRENYGTNAKTKAKVLVQLMSNEDCEKAQSLVYFDFVRSKAFCTRAVENAVHGETNLVCFWDDGAPVIFSNRLQWHQEGIMSEVTGGTRVCGFKNPVVYMKVKYYIGWIEENIEP